MSDNLELDLKSEKEFVISLADEIEARRKTFPREDPDESVRQVILINHRILDPEIRGKVLEELADRLPGKLTMWPLSGQ